MIPATLCTVKYEPLQSIESSTGKKIFSRPQNKTENQTNEYDYEEISFFVFFLQTHMCIDVMKSFEFVFIFDELVEIYRQSAKIWKKITIRLMMFDKKMLQMFRKKGSDSLICKYFSMQRTSDFYRCRKEDRYEWSVEISSNSTIMKKNTLKASTAFISRK